MKRGLLVLMLCLFAIAGYAQKHMLSYDDFKYLLQNNVTRSDTFLMAKGYTIYKPNKGFKKRKYQFTEADGRITELEIVIEGRKVTLIVETCEMLQYDIIKDSIGQFGYSVNSLGEENVYHVKDLGDVFVSIRDAIPYSPIKKDYYISLRGEKELTVLN